MILRVFSKTKKTCIPSRSKNPHRAATLGQPANDLLVDPIFSNENQFAFDATTIDFRFALSVRRKFQLRRCVTSTPLTLPRKLTSAIPLRDNAIIGRERQSTSRHKPRLNFTHIPHPRILFAKTICRTQRPGTSFCRNARACAETFRSRR